MLDILWIVVQIVSLVALIYGAWLIFTNRDLWRKDERDPRRHPRNPRRT